MVDKTQELNNQIARAVFELVPQEWSTATVKVMMLRNYAEMESTFAPKRGGPLVYFEVGFGVHDLFEELRVSMYEDVGAAWYVAILSMAAGGAFTFTYNYEDTTQFDTKPTPAEIQHDLQRYPRKRPKLQE